MFRAISDTSYREITMTGWELQVHTKQNHAADDDDESGKYLSDDDSLVEETSPDDPNLKCVECNT